MAYGKVYLLIDGTNDFEYVGQTTRSVEKRFKEHAKCKTTYIGKAIRTHGAENFVIVLLKECANKEEMAFWERNLIKSRNTKSPNGYNLTDGGEGIMGCTDETRAKISKTFKGKPLSLEHRAKIAVSQRGEKNNNYGKHPTNEAQVKMSSAKRTSPYKNLLKELDALQITYVGLAKILKLTISAVAYKMRGKVAFKTHDKAKLVEFFGKPIEYLLARDEG